MAAGRTVNVCYRRCIASGTDVAGDDFIYDLYMAEQCCEFVTRYNVRKMADAWNRCCATRDLTAHSTDRI